MAAAYTTLLDVAKANGSDPVVGLIDETSKATPEVRYGAARTIKGLNFKTLVRVALPTAGFRSANEGSPNSKSVFENRLVDTFILNPRWVCDKAVADGYEDGAASFIALEAESITEAAMQALGRCFYYGRNQWAVGGTTYGGDPKGFPGLIDGYDNVNLEIDAGGTTANGASSVWAVKFGPQQVQWVYGMNGELTMSDVMEQQVLDPNGNGYTAYIQEMLARPGLQIGSIRHVGRIKNLTAETSHTLTDAMLYSLLGLFVANIQPDAIFMSRRSLSQLRGSRTATNVTGAPAPIPAEIGGIPIYPTDSLTNVEPINFLGK